MVSFIMERVRNRSFTLTTGNCPKSRLRRLRNGIPQGLVLAPLSFTIYTYDLPTTISKKFAYADDLAILHSTGDWQTLEATLTQDMKTLSSYLQKWKLKLGVNKTVAAAFHLYNREARRELTINVEERALLFSTIPTYLGVKLDRALTFRQNLESLRKKLTTRVKLLRRLAGSSWGAGAITLRTATLALVHSTAEYCEPVCCRSTHTRLVDRLINDALRRVTGCLRPTPTDDLYTLAGIQPSKLRRERATLSLAHRAQDPKHMLQKKLLSPPSGGHRQLKSRRLFVPAALDSLNDADALSTSAAGSWADHKWNTEGQECASRLHGFIADVGFLPSEMHFPRPAWVRLNRLRIGVGLFHSTMHKWGKAPSPACECGADEQTADHLISCPIYRHPNGAGGFASDDMTLKNWVLNTCPAV